MKPSAAQKSQQDRRIPQSGSTRSSSCPKTTGISTKNESQAIATHNDSANHHWCVP